MIQTSKAEVIPIEVKSAKNVAAKSLQRFVEAAHSPYAIRISENQFATTPIEGIGCTLRSIPLYATFYVGD